jgi:endo-1,4-beta-D-glucanase Y
MLLLTKLLVLMFSAAASKRPPPTLPSIGAAQSGVYRNMFAEAGYEQDEIDTKVKAAFEQIYFGDAATQRIYYEVPEEGSAYVTDAKNGDVRTEGMGYGMMVMVQMNNQTGFDMLWKWVKLHMYHGDKTDPLFGWSAWHATTNGTRLANGPAPDGETWFITSLYFAAARWGTCLASGEDYGAEADVILEAVTSKRPSSQDMFTPPGGPTGSIVRFDPGTSYTDPSYFLPAFYVGWAKATKYKPASRWNDAAINTRDVLYASINHTTGTLDP